MASTHRLNFKSAGATRRPSEAREQAKLERMLADGAAIEALRAQADKINLIRAAKAA